MEKLDNSKAGRRSGERIAPAEDPGTGSPASASRIARNTMAQAVGAAASYLATLVFYVVLARVLGDKGFGDFTFALSIGVLVSISALGTDFAITREVARDRDRVHEVFWNSVAIRLGFGALGVAVALGVTWATGYASSIVVTTAILASSSLVAVLAQAIQAALRGFEDMSPIAMAWFLQRVFTAVVAGAVVLLGGGLIEAAVVYLLGSVLGLVYSAAILLRRHVTPQLAISWERSKELMGTSIPLAVGNLMVVILARLDVVILSALKGNVAVGIYGAAYRLFEGTSFFSIVFGLSAYPALSRLDRHTQPTIGEAYEKGCKALMLILIPLGLGFLVFAEAVVGLLYGSEYADSASALRFLGVATPLWGLLAFTIFVLAAIRRQTVVGWILAFGVLANVGLNLFLVPRYSVDGAALAMAASLALIDVALIAAAVREVGPIRAVRICAGPLVGAGTLIAVGFGLGTGLAAFCVAVVACIVATAAIERLFFTGDVAFMLRALREGFVRQPQPPRDSGTSVEPRPSP